MGYQDSKFDECDFDYMLVDTIKKVICTQEIQSAREKGDYRLKWYVGNPITTCTSTGKLVMFWVEICLANDNNNIEVVLVNIGVVSNALRYHIDKAKNVIIPINSREKQRREEEKAAQAEKERREQFAIFNAKVKAEADAKKAILEEKKRVADIKLQDELFWACVENNITLSDASKFFGITIKSINEKLAGIAKKHGFFYRNNHDLREFRLFMGALYGRSSVPGNTKSSRMYTLEDLLKAKRDVFGGDIYEVDDKEKESLGDGSYRKKKLEVKY